MNDLDKIKICPSLRAEMVEFFRSDVALLEWLIDRDLMHWLGRPSAQAA